MAKVEQILDDKMHTLVNEARIAYRGGQSTESVHKSVEALLAVLQKQPDIFYLQPTPDTSVRRDRIWPQLGVKVEQAEGQPPRVVFQRDQFSKAEAITFYEFALDTVVAAKM